MKTLAYLDCPTGISGDMCLGALVHAGVPLGYLKSQLARLGIEHEYQLRAEIVLRNQQAATKVHVDLVGHHPYSAHTHGAHSHGAHSHGAHDHDEHNHEHHVHQHEHAHHGNRKLPEIEALIQQADLPAQAAAWSLAVFRRLAKAEATVHGIPPEQVHFHEVGATDAIVDIVGTCLGLDWLEVDGLVCSPLPTGGGTVRCEHGLLPVPAPAVLSMMMSAGIPVYSNGIEKELVTPTGCAIAATLADAFGPPPRFTLQKVGLGAGGRDLALPNVLRLWIGVAGPHPKSLSRKERDFESKLPSPEGRRAGDEGDGDPAASSKTSGTKAPRTETIVELQTQLDDISPQAIAYTQTLLFEAGAVDVFTQAIAMKKNRLGTLLTVLCPERAAAACEALIFRETTTLGIRRTQQQRSVLDREIITVQTDYGEIPVKVASAEGKVVNMQPEYEDCARVARSHNVPFQQVHRAAIVASVTLHRSKH